MNPFAIATPKDHVQAAALLRDSRFSLPVLKGGGVDLIDHWKEGLTSPDLVVDVRRLRAGRGARPVTMTDGSTLRIEGNATLSEIIDSSEVRTNAPVLASALEFAATPQIRNVATAAGNLLQRPRCWYYRSEELHCLKKGGATCFAVEGENQYHAIFGDGPCHIVHPSNLAPALFVCDGVVHLTGGSRESVSITELYHMPDVGVRNEHNLKAGEIITHISVTAAPKSGFYAVKEKQSFDWPLAFAAVSLQLKGATITSARVCAGAVAPVPWPLPAVEKALAGLSLDDPAALRSACAQAAQGAKPMTQNSYKVRLLSVVVHRAVLRAAGRDVGA